MVSMATPLHCGATKDSCNQEAQLCQGIGFCLFSPSSAAADPGGTAASSCPPHLPHSHTQRQGQEAHDGKLLRFYDYCYS